MDAAMNYEDLAVAVYDAMEHGQSAKIIERACLEAQMAVLKEIASHSKADVQQGEFTSELIAMGYYTDKALAEIEAKLKAMK